MLHFIIIFLSIILFCNLLLKKKKKKESFATLDEEIAKCGANCKCKYGAEVSEDSVAMDSGCVMCFPDSTVPKMDYDPVCANKTRLQKCNCGIKGLCSPCQEDFDRAYIYALQKMCINRGYIWKYAKGTAGRTRGYVWDCLHTEETCKKEAIRTLIHPEKDPNYETSDKYFEWDEIANKCLHTSPYLRNICEGQDRFWYDCRGSVRGINKCHISESYCNKYAQDGFRKRECYVPTGQLVAENVFGETGIRAARVGYKCPTHHEPGYGKVAINTADPGACKLNKEPYRSKADKDFSRWR